MLSSVDGQPGLCSVVQPPQLPFGFVACGHSYTITVFSIPSMSLPPEVLQDLGGLIGGCDDCLNTSNEIYKSAFDPPSDTIIFFDYDGI
jgi:hypothetical protein